MDMCEYMWSNEMAMRRLLNMVSRFFIFSPKIFSHNYVIVTQLRHGQSYCTDTECIDRKFEKIKFTFINFLQKKQFSFRVQFLRRIQAMLCRTAETIS